MQETKNSHQLITSGSGRIRSSKYQLNTQAVESNPLSDFMYSPSSSIPSKIQEPAPLILDDFFLDVSESTPKKTVQGPAVEESMIGRHGQPVAFRVETRQQNLHGNPDESASQEHQMPRFEGDGFKEVGSARKRADDVDDEFDYAFEGGQREGATHKQVFKAKPIPQHLLMNVKQKELVSVAEDEDAGHGEEEEEAWGNRGVTDESSDMEMKASPLIKAPWRDPFLTGKVFQNPAFVGEIEELECQRPAHTTGLTNPDADSTLRRVDDEDLLSKRESQESRPAATSTNMCTSSSPLMSNIEVCAKAGTAVGSKGQPTAIQPAALVRGQQQQLLQQSNAAVERKSLGMPHNAPSALIVDSPAGETPSAVAADEWDQANQRVEVRSVSDDKDTPVATQLVTYMQVQHQLLSQGVDEEVRQLLVADLSPRPSFLARCLCLTPPPLCSLQLQEEQVHILALARKPYSESEPLHFSLLCSLFSAYTGREVGALSRYGSHWTELGFQGQDPATDLRSCGVLGLLHLYFLYHHSRPNAMKIFRLSRSELQNFPLSVVSLNITLWTLQVMKAGKLSKEANACGSMVDATARFYIGTFYMFYNLWLKGSKTMSDSGYVLRDVEKLCKRRPQNMLDLSADPLIGLTGAAGPLFYSKGVL
ncbi:hypothetical protein CEUSTIGMA_g4269.t1 [Chlamydomonas eustigma]|uniref:ELMO domain-containing protein n=1 Tax=Chlamydomonas eustigma TaxID=1157962 RepID=A0A250X160_9CHLO|nr:hypothetical protein CEUSTIGMA_g4269.t1 [Chlamydomonas eustigma]|eukprot:GAX76823.1 hypothetical protein CEUSTIGMA_g4269.t1 [Chlamydomonas eustigma]